MTRSDAERQKEHYERIHDDYEAHYYDRSSMAYRRRFIYPPLFEGLDFNGRLVADLACGSGYNSLALVARAPQVICVGYDISPSACEAYRRVTAFEAFECDLTTFQSFEPVYDAALVVGGLHHCVSDLPTTLRNIAAMVKPGGLLMMMEPNNQFALNSVREWWYRNDKWFDEQTESPLNHDEILGLAAPYFVSRRVSYHGGPAFYLILNSLVTRVPLAAKPWLAPLLMPVEAAWDALPGRGPFAYFTAVWERTPAGLRS